ncbi:MAG: YccT family protein [Endozoicomonas sp.]|uniref:YccT family protein n=1 Tax=Endozoicomonas sp. TaxID=1892382 RepID=UPI003D9BF115
MRSHLNDFARLHYRSWLHHHSSLHHRSWLNQFLMAVLSLFMVTSVWAAEAKTKDATLKLPVKSELLVLDGVSAKELDFKVEANKPITLSDERHQVVFQLSDVVTDGGDRNRFTSKPFILTFHPIAGQKYTIDAPKLKNMRQAESINNNPTSKITLMNAKGEAVPFEFAILPTKGIQFGRNYAADTQKFNRTDSPAAASEFSGMGVFAEQNTGFANVTQNEEIYGSAANQKGDANMSASMLRYWFEKSDQETRKAFINWAQEQVSQ